MSFGETGSRKVQKTTRIPYEALRKFVAEVFMRLGLPDSDAQIEADCLLKANLRGFETHGVARTRDPARGFPQRLDPRQRYLAPDLYLISLQAITIRSLFHCLGTLYRASARAARRAGSWHTAWQHPATANTRSPRR